MNTIHNNIERARYDLQQHVLNKIAEVEDFSEFHRRIRVMFAHVGLDLKDEGKEFLKKDFADATKRGEYMKEIEVFLRTHIR